MKAKSNKAQLLKSWIKLSSGQHHPAFQQLSLIYVRYVTSRLTQLPSPLPSRDSGSSSSQNQVIPLTPNKRNES